MLRHRLNKQGERKVTFFSRSAIPLIGTKLRFYRGVFMNIKRFLFLSMLIGAGFVAVASTATAQTRFVGTLESLSPCHVLPPKSGEVMCVQKVVPISGRVTITSKKGFRTTLPIREDGRFSTRLAPGEYTIKLAEASYRGQRLRVSELLLSSNKLTVGNRPFRNTYVVFRPLDTTSAGF